MKIVQLHLIEDGTRVLLNTHHIIGVQEMVYERGNGKEALGSMIVMRGQDDGVCVMEDISDVYLALVSV